MNIKKCTYEGCDKKYHSRGYCQGHAVLDRRGEPLRPLRSRRTEKVSRAASLSERLWSNVDKSGECWVWTGYTDDYGHGKLFHNGETYSVHREAYREQFGTVPEGNPVVQTCQNPACVRPEHLEALDMSTATYARSQRDVAASGYPNVYALKGRWQVKFVIDGKTAYVGLFDTPEEGHKAAEAFRTKYDLALSGRE